MDEGAGFALKKGVTAESDVSFQKSRFAVAYRVLWRTS
jgi:hypothetical protein